MKDVMEPIHSNSTWLPPW